MKKYFRLEAALFCLFFLGCGFRPNTDPLDSEPEKAKKAMIKLMEGDNLPVFYKENCPELRGILAATDKLYEPIVPWGINYKIGDWVYLVEEKKVVMNFAADGNRWVVVIVFSEVDGSVVANYKTIHLEGKR